MHVVVNPWALCRGGCGVLVSVAHRPQGFCKRCFPGKGALAQKKRLATLRAKGVITTGREMLDRAGAERKIEVRHFEEYAEALVWKQDMARRGYRVSVHFAGEGYAATAYPVKGKVKN